MNKIGVLIIATGKYKQFVQQIVSDIEKYFLVDQSVAIYLFTDEPEKEYKYSRGIFQKHEIPSYKFPHATLYRYKIFADHEQFINENDYLFYIDVDMRIVDYIGEEILPINLLGVFHPGFYTNNKWGSENVGTDSKAFVSKQNWGGYLAGGFQGGKAKEYITASKILAERIAHDENRDIIAEHNDESHWNKLAKDIPESFMKLSPAYCMVEDIERRKLWGIDHFPVKIIALNKNHEELRS